MSQLARYICKTGFPTTGELTMNLNNSVSKFFLTRL